MIMGLKQEKIKFKPRMKFNHNMYMVTTVSYMLYLPTFSEM